MKKKVIMILILSLFLFSCSENEKIDIEKKAEIYNKNNLEKINNIKKEKVNIESNNILKNQKKENIKITEKINKKEITKKEIFELCEKAIENKIWCTLNENYQIEKIGTWEVLKSKDFILLKRTTLTHRWTKEGKNMVIPSFIWNLETRDFNEFEKSNFINMPVWTIVVFQKYKLEIIKKINEDEFFKYLKETFQKHWNLEDDEINKLFTQLKKEIVNSKWPSNKDIEESKIFMIWNLLISKIWKWNDFKYWENICIKINDKKECWVLSEDYKNQKTSDYMIWNITVNTKLKSWTKFRFFANWGHKWGFSDEIIILDK